jgi:hypothetical protein
MPLRFRPGPVCDRIFDGSLRTLVQYHRPKHGAFVYLLK